MPVGNLRIRIGHSRVFRESALDIEVRRDAGSKQPVAIDPGVIDHRLALDCLPKLVFESQS